MSNARELIEGVVQSRVVEAMRVRDGRASDKRIWVSVPSKVWKKKGVLVVWWSEDKKLEVYLGDMPPNEDEYAFKKKVATLKQASDLAAGIDKASSGKDSGADLDAILKLGLKY